MIVVLVISIGFLVPKAAAPQPEVPHKDHALTPTFPEYRGGNQTASATTGVHSHNQANKRSPRKSCRALAARRSSLVPMSPQKS
jgi:hypothetical protein